jgi:hypothetical protein
MKLGHILAIPATVPFRGCFDRRESSPDSRYIGRHGNDCACMESFFFDHLQIRPMNLLAHERAQEIFHSATPVIRIHAIGGRSWRRNVAKGGRIGPWLQAKYDILNQQAWGARIPCLYLVSGADGVIRYVGISRNRMKDRWRESPALDADTMAPWPEKQLFHSQCWKHIERENAVNPSMTYEVRCINADVLLPVLERQGPPLSAFSALRGDGEGIVAAVERWLCNNKSEKLVSWNVAMTK